MKSLFARIALLLTAASASALEWKTTQLAIQAAPMQRTAECTFEFKNIGDKTVTITGVDTSCDCTEAKPSAKTFAPGTSGTLSAHFNLTGASGTMHRMITVATDEGQ